MLTLVITLLLGAPSVEVDLAVRAETRGSRLAPSAQELDPERRGSAELTPTLGLVLDDHAWRLRGAYAPRLWSPDLQASRFNVDHQLLLRTDLRPVPALQVALTGTAVRGVLDPLADPWTDFSITALPPSTRPQSYQNARGALDGTLRLGPRTGLAFASTATWSVGTDARSRLILPLQRTYTSALVLENTVAARDQLAFTVEGTIGLTYPDVGPDREADFALAGVRWERRLGRQVRGWIQAGASWIREASTEANTVVGYAPGGELGAIYEADRNGLGARTSLRFAPDLDRGTGEARRAFTWASTLTWQASPRWIWNAGLNASLAVPEPGGTAFAGSPTLHEGVWEPSGWGAELRVLRRLENGMAIEGGARMRRQWDRRTVQGSFSEAGLFVALDWTVSRSRPEPPPPPVLP